MVQLLLYAFAEPHLAEVMPSEIEVIGRPRFQFEEMQFGC